MLRRHLKSPEQRSDADALESLPEAIAYLT
jgi:hypothetical protein